MSWRLSFDLGPRLVIVRASKIPENDEDPRAPLMKDALLALGQQGDRTGATLALEIGQDSGAVVAGYLKRFDAGSLAVCFNPGNLLINGNNPIDSARDLGKAIAYAHATDARYSGVGKAAREVPLGHGDIDWLQMIGTFEEIDYHGTLVIDREPSAQSAMEVAASVRFLRTLTG